MTVANNNSWGPRESVILGENQFKFREKYSLDVTLTILDQVVDYSTLVRKRGILILASNLDKNHLAPLKIRAYAAGGVIARGLLAAGKDKNFYFDCPYSQEDLEKGLTIDFRYCILKSMQHAEDFSSEQRVLFPHYLHQAL